MKKIVLQFGIFLILICSTIQFSHAQVLISSGSGTPDPSAMLEIRSNTQGLLIPRLTTDLRDDIPATTAGLLVYDTDLDAFFITNGTKWVNLSSSSEIWQTNSTNVYLASPYTNVGIGTGNSPGGKLVIKDDDGDPLDVDVLFQVLGNDGWPVFEVTTDGVRAYVKEHDGTKGASGGFAVGKYGIAKDLENQGDLLFVNYKGTRIYTTGTVEAGGGFAVGQWSQTGPSSWKKNLSFYTSQDQTRVYAPDLTSVKGASGGFAVGKYGIAKDKANDENYMFMVSKNYFIGHHAGEAIQNDASLTGAYNTFFGFNSGLINTTGYNNIFIGYETGKGNLTGYSNTFVGFNSGLVNSSGSNNTFIGNESGFSNTEGIGNLFLGYQSGYTNTIGNSNSFMGYQAGYGNTSGLGNSFVGSYAGKTNSTGEYNTFVGFNSGFSNIGGTLSDPYLGSNNVFLGTGTGYSNTIGFSNVYIGPACGYYNTEGNFNVFIGHNAGSLNTLGSSNIFIGTEAGLKNDGTGSPNYFGCFNLFMGHAAGTENTQGNYNIFLGYHAGFSNTVGSSNFFAGTEAGNTNLEGYGNIFIGNKSGFSNDYGLNNVFIGNEAGYSNISDNPPFNEFDGSNNIFLGNYAGWSNQHGINNIYLGYEAGFSTVWGTDNTCIGTQAGRDNEGGGSNLFIGSRTGFSNFSGYNNVFMGVEAGYLNKKGHDNIFIGKSAGYNNSSPNNNESFGSFNIFLGVEAGLNNLQGSNNTYIGNMAGKGNEGSGNVFIGSEAAYTTTPSTKSNLLYIDNSNTTSPLIWGDFANRLINFNASKVGIKTASPDAMLEMVVTEYNGTARAGLGIKNSDKLITINHGTYNMLNFTVPGVVDLVTFDFGNFRVGINNTNPGAPLQVGTNASNGNGAYLTAGGVWTDASSIEFKDRFQDLNKEELLLKIEKLNIKGWYYKGSNEFHIWPFAEEFHNAFGTGDSNNSEVSKYLAGADVAGVSLAGVQELIKQNKDMKTELDQLKSEIETLKQMVKDIQGQ